MNARLTMKGDDMYHYFPAIKNKHQKRSKVHFQQYLHNSDEPRDNFSHDKSLESEAELLEDSFSMRQQFRYTAQRLRKHTS